MRRAGFLRRSKRDILQKAIPDLFGNKRYEVKSNYVVFPVPAAVHRQVHELLDKGDGDALAVGISNQDKELRLVIVNLKEQKLGVKDYRR